MSSLQSIYRNMIGFIRRNRYHFAKKKHWKTEKCDSKFNSLVLFYTCITTTLDFRQDKTVCTAKMIFRLVLHFFLMINMELGDRKKKSEMIFGGFRFLLLRSPFSIFLVRIKHARPQRHLVSIFLGLESAHYSHHVLPADGAFSHLLATSCASTHVSTL